MSLHFLLAQFKEANFSVSEVAQMMSWKCVQWQTDSKRNGSLNFTNSLPKLKRDLQLLNLIIHIE